MEASASKQSFFAPYAFMRTSPKPLHSFHFRTAQIISTLIKFTFLSLSVCCFFMCNTHHYRETGSLAVTVSVVVTEVTVSFLFSGLQI